MLHDDQASALMATYAAYFDAGGHPLDRHALFVTGLVSTESKWLEFGKAWIKALKREAINQPFHMSAFMNGNGIYASWKDNDIKRMQTVTRLVAVVKDHIHERWRYRTGRKNAKLARLENL